MLPPGARLGLAELVPLCIYDCCETEVFLSTTSLWFCQTFPQSTHLSESHTLGYIQHDRHFGNTRGQSSHLHCTLQPADYQFFKSSKSGGVLSVRCKSARCSQRFFLWESLTSESRIWSVHACLCRQLRLTYLNIQDPVDAICELLAIIRFVESTLAPKTNPDGSEVDDIRILKVRIAQLEYTHLLYWRVDRLVKREVAEAYSLVGVARIFMANVRRLAAEAAKAPGGTRQLREEHKDERHLTTSILLFHTTRRSLDMRARLSD
ncbi:hypothetical protein IWZ01DRAFT_210614 [Phyllosticta capitalensis]